MTAIRVFDPAMCCSTGVCGPSVDPQLARFSADLDWLKAQGVSVERFNLAQQPGAFAQDPAVRAILEARADAGLPVVKANDDIKSSGVYPSREQLAAWAGVAERPPSLSHSAPIILKATAGGCCTPAADEPGDKRAATKS